MTSWVAWAVLVAAAAVLIFAGYHFTVRTLRITTALAATAVALFITGYGLAHPARAPADLASAFTRGADELSAALFRALRLGHQVPAPGLAGWVVILVALLFGYRMLEAWALRWQAPVLDTSKLGEGQHAQHAQLAEELRFRLAAMEVRSPSILPGGSRSNGLASIAEASGVTGSGLAGAIIRFFGMLWPSPRRYQLRLWVEAAPDTAVTKVTVDLEDPRTGATIVTRTVASGSPGELASMVAGYVGRQVFAGDRATPPWCVGTPDGRDLGALLLARQERADAATPGDAERSRQRQIEILARATQIRQCAGVVSYELAQLHDLGLDHLAALRLHAANREQYPRFYRGRYRLGMSLEMIANPGFTVTDVPEAERMLDDVLGILSRCGVMPGVTRQAGDLERVPGGSGTWRLSPGLSMHLLAGARAELGTIRRELTLRRGIWAALVHRDERGARRPYWRLRARQGFRDAVRVAELLVAVREELNVVPSPAGGGRRGHLRSAARMAAAIAGDPATAWPVPGTWPAPPPAGPGPAPGTDRIRWLPGQRRTASWQAAYNTACLYAVLAQEQRAPDKLVVSSLQRAVNNRDSEMERAYDWISHDPDFLRLKDAPETFADFGRFLEDLRRACYPAAAQPHAGSAGAAGMIPGVRRPAVTETLPSP
ncbi:MAG TPA: hypothetical protein VFX25_39085 [Streptosporangiaceae bacterium]|nr:hypothetical protein [Streptosporangiaceae bacterium]